MKLREDLLHGMERFFDLIPVEIRRRGHLYHAEGRVERLECRQPDQSYTAVVRGGQAYTVALNFADKTWAADCSCPMHYDCKHAVAAMLELQQRAVAAAPPGGPPIIPPQKRKKSWVAGHPAGASLFERFVRRQGRKPSPEEAAYLRQVLLLHVSSAFRKLTNGELVQLGSGPGTHTGPPPALWPERPADDYYFWLYLAWELRRRQAPYPKFMDGITDLSLIEPEMKAWEREREIRHWQHWFHNFEERATAPDGGPLELRLGLRETGAQLQWRTQADTKFADFKPAHAERFGQQFEQGTLKFAPDSLSLWSALFKPWHYESWWAHTYTDAPAKAVLNRVLRLSLPPASIVGADGQPLGRATEPLKLELRPPENGGDYELMLVTAAGSPPPQIFCTFEGQPTLYLTKSGLFQGPPAVALGTDWRKTIPAPALETTNGVRFLQAAGVPLPAQLAPRVRQVPVPVTLACALRVVNAEFSVEDIVVTVVARTPGMMPEQFTDEGWRVTTPEKVRKINPPAGEDTIVVPDRSALRHFPYLLDSLGVKKSDVAGEWALRVKQKTPELFAAWLKTVPPEIELHLDAELASLRDSPVSGSITLDVQEAGMDWFDLRVVLTIGDTTLTPYEVKLLQNARGGYVRLGGKGWRRLLFNFTPEEDEQLARLGLNARDFSAAPQRFHALQLADDAAKKLLAPERVEQIRRCVGELQARVAPALPAAIRADLRPYQTEGYHFLAYLTTNRFGGVLADDMGLGKTLQALAWLAWLRETTLHSQTAPRHPSLVVCPKSVTDNWVTEAERFYPGLRVRLWRGETASKLPEIREICDVLVINYAQLRTLSPKIAACEWLAVILDEAQYIKNPQSQTAAAARALQTGHRLALTGTPIENRLLDLWSIFAFAMPGVLGHRTHFLRQFNAADDPFARRRLAARVRPFLLRRTKGQVAKDLPDRIEEDLLCEMEGEQLTLYRAELKRARQLVLGLQSDQQLNDQRFNVLTSLLRLRQICCHPALVDDQLRTAESAKVAALLDLLEPIMEEGHKVLVFSQFVTMLELLRDTVTQRGWPHFYLTGSTENRGELVQEFQAAKDGAVFLISLKAGGAGLNLTAASYVVLFDPWWNPAVENQAIDRTHRIGQVRNVMAYRLLTRDSIEQKIRALQKQKAALMDDVLGEERFAQSLTLDDLRLLFAE